MECVYYIPSELNKYLSESSAKLIFWAKFGFRQKSYLSVVPFARLYMISHQN